MNIILKNVVIKKQENFPRHISIHQKPLNVFIHCIPDVQLIAILRNPVDRAYSQYRNAIKAGEITEGVDFDTYVTNESSCLAQGKYHEQLERYQKIFQKEQLLILIQEDLENDKRAFIQHIYKHIGVDSSFVPPSLNERINVARTPKAVGVDTGMHRIAEWLRRSGLDAFCAYATSDRYS